MHKTRAGPLLMVAIMLVAAFATGCATPDAALRQKSGEFTQVNQDAWNADRESDLPQGVVAGRTGKFLEHQDVAFGKETPPLSGEALRAEVLKIVDEQQGIWEADKRSDLPAGFQEIRRDEFASQKKVLRDKGR